MDEGANSGYREQIKGSGAHKEAVDAEIALTASRQETYAGLLSELRKEIAEERRHSAELRTRLTEELTLRRTSTHEDLQRRREDSKLSLEVINDALTLAHEAIERAKLTAVVLNTPPPPRTTAGENLTELGKLLIDKVGDIVAVALANDPGAAARIKALGGGLLSFGSAENAAAAPPQAAPPQPAAADAPAPAPARPAEPAPTAAAAKMPTALEMVRYTRRIARLTQEQIEKYCAEKGISVEELSIDGALKLADEVAAAAGANGGS